MWGSKLLGNYAKQAMNAGRFNRAAVAAGARQTIEGVGGVATGRYGATAAGAMYGAAGGGAYGAIDRDTSVLGGMLGGAALGAGGTGAVLAGNRYGGAYMLGRMGGGNAKTGLNVAKEVFKKDARRAMARGAGLASNQVGKMGKFLKNWANT